MFVVQVEEPKALPSYKELLVSRLRFQADDAGEAALEWLHSMGLSVGVCCEGRDDGESCAECKDDATARYGEPVHD